jgi:hypothetical protein
MRQPCGGRHKVTNVTFLAPHWAARPSKTQNTFFPDFGDRTNQNALPIKGRSVITELFQGVPDGWAKSQHSIKGPTLGGPVPIKGQYQFFS